MNQQILGALLLLGSSVIYGLFGIFSKQIVKFGFFSQGWIRYLIILLVISVMFVSGRIKWKRVKKKDIKWFLTWILPASFQPVLTFIAFTHLPIGITYFLIYATMISGGIISGKIFFAERLNNKKWISLFLILIGLVFIYQSDLALINNRYVLLALISGLIVGFWNTLTKKVSANYSEFQMIFLDSFSTFAISLTGYFFIKETLPSFANLNSWLWIIGFAISGILSSFLLIRGFKYIDAQRGSLILPMELVFASIFGFLFLGEVLHLNVYLGGLFIFIAAILPVLDLPKSEIL